MKISILVQNSSSTPNQSDMKKGNISNEQKNDENKINYTKENLLLEQIKYLQAELVSIQQAFLSVISIPLGIYGVMIYYAISLEESGRVLFVLLPFLFSLSFYNVLKYTIKMLGMDAYIRHLESLINEIRKEPLFLWQSKLIYSNGYSVLGCAAQLPCFVAILIFLGIKFIEVIQDQTFNLFPYWKPILISLLILQVLCFILMAFAGLMQYGNVLNYCQCITYENLSDLSKLDTAYPYFLQKGKVEKPRKN